METLDLVLSQAEPVQSEVSDVRDSFESLGLSDQLLRAIHSAGWENPTPVQCKAIPAALLGRDLIACAQTGTGKTGVFALTILQRMKPGRGPRALILTPTRELAVQVSEHFEILAKFSKCKIVRIYGGVNIDRQAKRLSDGADVVVATPGRLLDHIRRKNVQFKGLQFLVLDEADRMLDMGFAPDIRKILKLIPQKRQSMLYSATIPVGIRSLAGATLNDPMTIEVGRRSAPASSVEHSAYAISKAKKMDLLLHILKRREYDRLLLFARTRQDVNTLGQKLERGGFSVDLIHSDRRQREREKALSDFRKGKYQILVATDVAARGLDIEGIQYVINYNVPENPEDYIHRIGRTGRAESNGWAITLVTQNEARQVEAIERLIGKKIERQREADFDYGDFGYVLDLEEKQAGSSPPSPRSRRSRSFRRR